MGFFKREVCAVMVADGPTESNLSWREAKRIFNAMKQNDKEVKKQIKKSRCRNTRDLQKVIRLSCVKDGKEKIKRVYKRIIKYSRWKDTDRRRSCKVKQKSEMGGYNY